MKKLITLLLFPVAALILAGSIYLLPKEKSIRDKQADFLMTSAADYAQKIPAKENDLKAPDQPDMAAFEEYTKTLDPALGYVPKERAFAAYRQTVGHHSNLKSGSSYEPPIEWESTQANMGGRTRAIMFDPNSNEFRKVWAGGVTGGLWYNDDIENLSSEWEPVGDFWSNLAISCITYDPGNIETFYVGTGEAQTARIIYRESSGVGTGIFRSTDAGDTWELMESTADFEYITDIAVRVEDNVSVIYAAVASGTYKGIDHESTPSDGLYRSTDDGETWEQVLPLIPGFSNEPYTPADIEITANGRIFVGTMENLSKLGGATVLYSDLGTEGSWTTYDNYNDQISNEGYYNIPARTIVASAPSDPNRVYAQFAAGYTDGFTYYRGRYMAKSMDGGETWESMQRPDEEWSTLAWHAFILKVDPTDPDVIYTGGLDLWKSISAGQSWNHISDWSLMYYGGGNEYVHADQHNIQFQPGKPKNAVFTSDGGVFLTKTANLFYPIFIERNQGYNTLQFYTSSINPTPGSDEFIGGMQDNCTVLYDGALDINDMLTGGDGAFCFWDKNEPDVFLTSSQYNNYTTFYNYYSYDYFSGGGTFISPADYDYKLNTLYANGVTFGGSSRNRVLRASGIPFNVNENLVNIGTNTETWFSHVKYSRFAPQGTSTLFLGTTVGELYKVENAQDIPQATEIGSPDFPVANISCVALGNSEDVLLVTFSNYGVSSVWLTTDGGETWVEKESNLPDMPIRWAIFHPNNNGQALLATETGVWATNTLYEDQPEWSPATEGMANVRVDMLQIREADDFVVAATHGRGFFTTEYDLDIYTGLDENLAVENELTVYPNPATDVLNIQVSENSAQTARLNIANLNGKLLRNEVVSVNPNGLVKLDVSDLKMGTYILSFQTSEGLKSRKIVIN